MAKVVRVKPQVESEKPKKKRVRKSKCPFCKVVLVREKAGKIVRYKCPKCEYYERPLYDNTHLVKSYRKQMIKNIHSQQNIYNKLKSDYEKEQRRLEK